MKIIRMCSVSFLVIACLWGAIANAGVVVGGTRLVYDGGKREASLSVRNPDAVPYLIQAWTDADGVSGQNNGAPKPPFIVTPPLFRLDAGNENILRIVRTGGVLPEDRESIYWMNVKAIPASKRSDKNVLQLSIKTRIKLFYRPDRISAPTDEDYKSITFNREGNDIKITNPTPYYITFSSIKVGGAVVKTSDVMVPPKEVASFSMPTDGAGGQVSWQVINDFGGTSTVFTSPLM